MIMIQEVTMYQAVCDGCGKHGWAFRIPELAAKHAKSRLQWEEVDGKMYCPECVVRELESNNDSF